MKKTIIITMIILLLSTIQIIATDVCGDVVIINENCTLLTPALNNCNIYNYTIIKKNSTAITYGNLTSLYNDIYCFDFIENEGDYIIQLCDGTTREIRVIPQSMEEIKMLAIIFGMSVLMAFLIFFGTKINNPAIKWVAFVLASVEAVLISASIYAISMDNDISLLLLINLWSIGLSLMAMLLISLTTKNVSLAMGEEEDGEGKKSSVGDEEKWRKGWE